MASTHGISRISPPPRSSSQSGRGRLRGTARPLGVTASPDEKPNKYFRTDCDQQTSRPAKYHKRGVTDSAHGFPKTRLSESAADYAEYFAPNFRPKSKPVVYPRPKRKTRLQPPTRRSTSRPRDLTAEKNQTPSDLRFEPREPSLVSPRPRQKCPTSTTKPFSFPSTVFRNPPDPSAIPSQA